MNTHQKIGRILQIGLGLGVTAALVIASGCTSAGPASAEVGDPAVGESVEAFGASGIYRCSSGSAGPSTLVVNDDLSCFILHGIVAPGATPTYCIGQTCAACWSIARNSIMCNLPQ